MKLISALFPTLVILPLLPATAEEPKASATTPPDAYRAITTIDPTVPRSQLQIMVKPLTRDELSGEADAWFRLLRSKARQIAAARLGVKKTAEAMSAENETAAKSSLKSAQALTETAKKTAEKTERELVQGAKEKSGVENVGEDSEEQELDSSAEENRSTAPPQASDAGGPDAEVEQVEQAAAAVKKELLDDLTKLRDERTALSDRLEVVLASLELKGGEVQEYRDYIVAVSGIGLDITDAGSLRATLIGWLTSQEGGQRFALNALRFALILFFTYFVSSLVARIVNWLLERKVALSQLAENLISSTIRNVILLVGFAVALTALEIDVTPVLAAIGAAGLVVGLALQGTLSNFASGLMILVNRPFDVGNAVTAGGVTGIVDRMNLVSTTFRTFDNQTIHVPNNEIWNNVITNITANETRRVDLQFGIGYGDDFERAEEIIREVVTAHELVLEEPAPEVVTHELADSAVNIVCRPWAKTTDWWKVKTDITREVKRRFDQLGITIPYPQRDLHIYSVGSDSDGEGSKAGSVVHYETAKTDTASS